MSENVYTNIVSLSNFMQHVSESTNGALIYIKRHIVEYFPLKICKDSWKMKGTACFPKATLVVEFMRN